MGQWELVCTVAAAVPPRPVDARHRLCPPAAPAPRPPPPTLPTPSAGSVRPALRAGTCGPQWLVLACWSLTACPTSPRGSHKCLRFGGKKAQPHWLLVDDPEVSPMFRKASGVLLRLGCLLQSRPCWASLPAPSCSPFLPTVLSWGGGGQVLSTLSCKSTSRLSYYCVPSQSC